MTNKFRARDSLVLFDTMEHVEGLLAAIEAFSQESQDTEIPDESVVPTGILYNVLACYKAMFDLIVANELHVSRRELFDHQPH